MKPIYIGAFLLTGLIGGCASHNGSNNQAEFPSSTSRPTPSLSPVPPATAAAFAQWRNGFRAKAMAAGINPQVFDQAFANVRLNQEVMRLDGRQAEFTKPIWEYLDSAVSQSRVTTGRQKLRELGTTLAAIEQRYRVDAEVLLAIWGMETNYGSYRGNTSTIEGLATLAYEGRRRAFAEEQLIAALKILQSGDTRVERMRGSWAGAMGHTQFMPTSYLQYAQDFTGDGRRDIWSDDPTDALASTAYYLARFGWQQGAPWGIEVRLPVGFDYSDADQNNLKPVAYWRSQGITTIDGRALPDHGEAAILVPAGAQGPAFAIFQNFKVIRRYNNATSYAMGVGHLADRIAGGREFLHPWPRNERALSRSEKIELQRRLTERGFDTQGADGVIGPNSIGAIRRFQRSLGLTADGYPTESLLQRLR
ncbi:lytic murein transglycosylase [Zobellella maritima]|uniref:lytic murein transglycosylase n=1 Tax=Zobellella maritima TaxID=2059725 RepID=UPI000E3034A2|nr:lytic murein transglycosylase [Zobellella maritima]